jgi:hypothetical protein
VRPVAVVPLWQDAQLPLTWVWSTRTTGRHVVVEWQVSQLAVDWICDALFPVALAPSWQAAHPVVTPACEKLAGTQADVTWQVWQSLLEAMWLVDLPRAFVPSWHEKQVPVTWVWSTREAGRHVVVAWHDSQLVDVVR